MCGKKGKTGKKSVVEGICIICGQNSLQKEFKMKMRIIYCQIIH